MGTFHRTLIRVEDVAQGQIKAFIPAWSAKTGVSIPIENVPLEIRKLVTEGPLPRYLHAETNLSVYLASSLRFQNWETE